MFRRLSLQRCLLLVASLTLLRPQHDLTCLIGARSCDHQLFGPLRLPGAIRYIDINFLNS